MENTVGLTKDVGWQIGVSRTLPHPPEEVWSFLTSPPGLSLWLGPGATLTPEKGARYDTDDGTTGEVRSFRPGDRLRVTWQPPGWSHDSTVQVVVRPAAGGTSVRFHQERLADVDERAAQREHWRRVLEAIEAALSDG
ncbi:SRPBCC family protein [Cryptosporangium phraense]|uniref:SRPBCC domain-containing protein n=1 Tax=Cryptosporangium phraense TaxID=2593070 RepID=A0A545AMB9_9ACTN|nr:SRPBCC domain-containing protein [Cryptosporangium phraense]TQS42463.1 SRPBCC domain-containing protein [Cryptosporangium phraense]